MTRAADLLVNALVQQDICTIFALSGNQIMPIFDAALDHDMRLIHVRHEASAVYMAEAYAQLTGKPGVALVTAGGGLGNAVGALIAARASDTPLLLLSGDSPLAEDGQGAFQEIDQLTLTRAVTKGCYRIKNASEVVATIHWAMFLAKEGRPGPVHLALPVDILTAEASDDWSKAHQPEENLWLPDLWGLYAAERPVIMLGSLLNPTRAEGLAEALQQKFHAPVLVMESPRGLNDPTLGRLGSVAKEADYVLSIGKSVDFTVRFADVQYWPHLTRWDGVFGDDEQISMARQNLGLRMGWAIQASPMALARQLLALQDTFPERSRWQETVAELITARQHKLGDGSGIVPLDICQAVREILAHQPSSVLIVDGGEFGQWAQSAVQAEKRMINGLSGMIGGGIGYAMGAKVAQPESTVLAMMGDGSVGFHLPEFETAVREKLPFVVVIGNDQRWNAEYLIQVRTFGEQRRLGCELSDARYDLAVTALGGYGVHVNSLEDITPAIQAAIDSGLPACVNITMQSIPAPVL